MKKIGLAVLFSCITSIIWAQQVNNLTFETTGKTIQIRYDLIGNKKSHYDVLVFFSQDNGIWEGPLVHVAGDVGKQVPAGVNKMIIWDVLKEKEMLSGNLRFKLELTKYVKKPEIEWVSIPGGTYLMGSPLSETDRSPDETQHQVTLSAFKISKYEITFDQYDAFCEATGRQKPNDEGWGRGNRPVINVSWHDAKEFADWMGCRMPTEAEWEYACRAGTSSPFHSGNCLSTSQANYNGNNPYRNCKNGNFQKKTLPVGSFAPNSWGLYDMHGNVWEWCTDWYLFEFTIEIQTNPVGPTNGYKRVVRGGSWRDYALDCRAASRFTGDPYRCFSSIGFRLVSTE